MADVSGSVNNDVEEGVGTTSPVHAKTEAPAEITAAEETKPKEENMELNHIATNASCVWSIICGIQYFNDCNGIPGIAWFCLMFGLVQLFLGAQGYYYRIPKGQEALKLHPNQTAVGVSQFAGIVQVAVAIWGACITFPVVIKGGFKLGEDFEYGGDTCNGTLFVVSFVMSAICTGIVALIFVGMAAYGIFNYVTKTQRAES